MKPLTLSDRDTIVLALQDEIRRSLDSRYDHRLHGVLLVAQGLTCPEVALVLGDAPRTAEYWVQRFEARGFAGLADGPRPGRPCCLTDPQVAEVQHALRQTPQAAGLPGPAGCGMARRWRPSCATSVASRCRSGSASACSASGGFVCGSSAP